VESQEAVATSQIVDSFAEQDVLEAMLDAAKPQYRKGTEGLHYLLKTAFRYPPLEYGSRFGTQLMPSYFYASEEFQTALCETAYYRFLFLEHMQSAYEAPIRSEYSLFRVTVGTENCLDLTAANFKKFKSQLADPQSYHYSHSVGQWQWLCLTRWYAEQPEKSSVSFRSRESADIYEYQRSEFCDRDGRLLVVKY